MAPHPDDDVLGCGALLARAVDVAAGIRVVYVTDGSASHPASRGVPRPELARIREREALDGLVALGVDPGAALFLRAPDGALRGDDPALRRDVREALDRARPTLICLPVETDRHPDHRASARLVDHALARIACRPRRFAYAVWPPDDAGTPREHRRVWVDAAPVLPRKRRALAAHRSQFGRVVRDDPAGFRLPHALVVAACGERERFFERGPA